MLDNYLHLEELRFRGCFDFFIHADGLDPKEIQMPPMLVQPFVENAIKHGLQALESRGNMLSTGDGKGGAENLVRETLLDAEGRAVGACVRFFIPV